jgi:hypothetical protein
MCDTLSNNIGLSNWMSKLCKCITLGGNNIILIALAFVSQGPGFWHFCWTKFDIRPHTQCLCEFCVFCVLCAFVCFCLFVVCLFLCLCLFIVDVFVVFTFFVFLRRATPNNVIQSQI